MDCAWLGDCVRECMPKGQGIEGADMRVIAGCILYGIAVLIIFLPTILTAVRNLSYRWDRHYVVPCFFGIALSTACMVVGTLLIAGFFTIDWGLSFEKVTRLSHVRSPSFYDDMNVGEKALFHLKRGLSFSRKGRYGEAIEEYNRAIDYNPCLLEAYHNCGIAYVCRGESRKAIATFKAALDLNSAYIPSLTGMGGVYQCLGRHQQAVTYYTRALREEPENPDAHYNLGLIYADMRCHDMARKEFESAIRAYRAKGDRESIAMVKEAMDQP